MKINKAAAVKASHEIVPIVKAFLLVGGYLTLILLLGNYIIIPLIGENAFIIVFAVVTAVMVCFAGWMVEYLDYDQADAGKLAWMERAARTIEPEKSGDIKDILRDAASSLKEFAYLHITRYVIVDPEPYEIELGENDLGKYIIMKDPLIICFVAEGKIVDDVGIYRGYDGKSALYYTGCDQETADIINVDYIGSYRTLSDTLTLIPNPFKK